MNLNWPLIMETAAENRQIQVLEQQPVQIIRQPEPQVNLGTFHLDEEDPLRIFRIIDRLSTFGSIIMANLDTWITIGYIHTYRTFIVYLLLGIAVLRVLSVVFYKVINNFLTTPERVIYYYRLRLIRSLCMSIVIIHVLSHIESTDDALRDTRGVYVVLCIEAVVCLVNVFTSFLIIVPYRLNLRIEHGQRQEPEPDPLLPAQAQLTEIAEMMRTLYNMNQAEPPTEYVPPARDIEAQQQIGCCICQVNMCDSVFYCGHTICQQCAERVKMDGDSPIPFYKCPTCRKYTIAHPFYLTKAT